MHHLDFNAHQAAADPVANRRLDWYMRQFVDEVKDYLARGGEHANALHNLYERGVPVHVARRVIANAPH